MKEKKKTVGRLDLIERIYQNQSILHQDEVKVGFDTVLATMAKFLTENQRIEIRGFGSFTLRTRAERIGRNPRTGEVKLIGTRYAPHFKPSRRLNKVIEAVEPQK